MSEPIRLDKCVAALFGCSRGEAQQYIEGGWVSVDGVVVEEPQTLATAPQVTLAADAVLAPAEPATLLLHKSAGMTAEAALALAIPAARSSLDQANVRVLKRHFLRLSAPLPLEDEASGLLVLSQDGRVLRRLSADATSIEQEFLVEVSGELRPYGMARLAHGLVYQQRSLSPCKVSWQNEERLRFAIKHVQPGQLRFMCKEVGLEVVSIRRLRVGRISLGKLAIGEWRYLPAGERF
ncbi:rRNA pseudouridine synthase [Xanthomonas hortorum]|uniref:Dual-specificity RNA pseudouridine synthase RluF n=2 Tax=Xanthomonas hortorum TaxID=56454 RepID=A0A6V7CCR8_9XANT|nr:rRNA pseudouridine synthase [Xanthomonas hortorum]APP81545.1 RNA-binding protein [Xanthomonas hortorum pv. gardneri]EGD21021.1 pseudouridylate synthase, 16S rRNA uridine-516 [Xanthomonas hortorum ATCC 19865]KLA94972.1 RNA-binding protein S4 [Xanthomonas hortorum pv. gardneri]KLA98861.1 RNA-binding protein S4 [Xanthomonas hortorum pv. gardneri]KLB02685.1 RNA-binding protein S4 [Xanthomonas hortorum pv. gardneri]